MNNQLIAYIVMTGVTIGMCSGCSRSGSVKQPEARVIQLDASKPSIESPSSLTGKTSIAKPVSQQTPIARSTKEKIALCADGAAPDFNESKLAGEKIIVSDMSVFFRSVRSFLLALDAEKLDPDFPNRLLKTSSRPEIYDIEKLLKYRGPSSEQNFIKDGRTYQIGTRRSDHFFEMYFHKIDILLSAHKIPFVFHYSRLGWNGYGMMYIIVERQNYRETAKLLDAAIKHGAITDVHED